MERRGHLTSRRVGSPASTEVVLHGLEGWAAFAFQLLRVRSSQRHAVVHDITLTPTERDQNAHSQGGMLVRAQGICLGIRSFQYRKYKQTTV